MLENIHVLGHNALQFKNDDITLYVDPFQLNESYHNAHDADLIFITHSHFDHLSEEDIGYIRKEDSVIVVPEDAKLQVLKMGFKEKNILTVEPNRHYYTHNIEFYTLPAYNENKTFHPIENGWVGYNINIEGIWYYIAGDTDNIEILHDIECDVAFLPVGGTYTMTYVEAAILANEIQPRIVIPVHYGVIVGNKEDALNFARLVDQEIKVYLNENKQIQ